MKHKAPFFVFDVESIGLHGEAFAVAGGVYLDGVVRWEFNYCCPLNEAKGDDGDREWVKNNVPVIPVTHRNPYTLKRAFWREWQSAKSVYPNIAMAAECLWPVEANFISSCIAQAPDERKWEGPYPFHEIASVMFAAGMDPMATYDREPSEMPAHEPLADTRLSARLLSDALHILTTNNSEKT